MLDPSQTNHELLQENACLRQRVQSLEILQLQHKLAEEALRDSYVARYSITGILLFASDSMYYVTGYSPEEIIGTSGFNRVHPDDRFQVQSKLKETIEKGRSNKAEYRTICKDGGYKWVEIVAKVVHDDQTGQDDIIAAVRDISERKSIEEKSQNMLNFLQSLFNTVPSPIFCKNINYQYVDCNKEFEDYTGVKKVDILGKSVYDIYPKNIADKYHDKDFALFSNPGRQIYESSITYADGIERDVVVRKATYVDADGSLAGLIGIMVDITERKRAEEALKKSETKLRTLYDSTSDAVMLSDEKGFLDCNNKALTLFGCASNEEFCRLHPADLSPPQQPCGRDSFSLANEMIKTALEKGSIHFEWLHKRNDIGETFPADVLLTAMELDDRPVVQAVVRDITMRKRAEEYLKQSERKFATAFLKNAIPAAITTIKEGRYVEVSDSFLMLMGLERSAVVGNTSTGIGFITQDQRAIVLSEFKEKGSVVNLELQIRTKGGEQRYGLFNSVKVSFSDEDHLLTMVTDITELKRVEDELAKHRGRLEVMVKERTRELENKNNALEEMNIAMKVLLHRREEDRKELEDRFVMNIKSMILPFAEKLKSTTLDETQLAYLSIVETHLNDIISPLIKKMHQFNFTPKEVEVASLLNEGKSTKEIAKIVGIETCSVNTHRINIRKKLGISKKNVNLRSHLLSFK